MPPPDTIFFVDRHDHFGRCMYNFLKPKPGANISSKSGCGGCVSKKAKKEGFQNMCSLLKIETSPQVCGKCDKFEDIKKFIIKK